jgi:hypothetical protein
MKQGWLLHVPATRCSCTVHAAAANETQLQLLTVSYRLPKTDKHLK